MSNGVREPVVYDIDEYPVVMAGLVVMSPIDDVTSSGCGLVYAKLVCGCTEAGEPLETACAGALVLGESAIVDVASSMFMAWTEVAAKKRKWYYYYHIVVLH